MFIAALVVPGVFSGEGVLFGAAFLVVCAIHVTLYAFTGRGNRDLVRAVLRLAPWTLLGATHFLELRAPVRASRAPIQADLSGFARKVGLANGRSETPAGRLLSA